MVNGQWSMLNAQCSMLNAQCSMLNAQCSMLNAQLTIVSGAGGEGGEGGLWGEGARRFANTPFELVLDLQRVTPAQHLTVLNLVADAPDFPTFHRELKALPISS